MTRPTLLATVLVSTLAAASAGAQPVSLTLDQAIERALEASHRLAEALARRQGAEAAVATRRAADAPRVAVSSGYARTNHVDQFGVPQPDGSLRVIFPDIPDNYFARASLEWPIYAGGRVEALERAAAAEARAAAGDVDVTRADLRLEVGRVYWAVVTAIDSVRVLEEAVARADVHLADVKARFDAGLVPPNDVASVEAQRSRQQVLLVEARNLRDSLAEDLRRLTGFEGVVVPAERLGPGAFEATRVEQAVAARPDRAEIRALESRVEAAEQRRAAAVAQERPTIAVTGAADYANPNPRIFPRQARWRTSWEVGIVATWNVWDGRRVASEVAEADAAARAVRARLADVDALVRSEVRQRRLDLDSARAAVTAAADAVRSADEARRVVTERFTVGVATSTEVIDAQVALLQAELDRTRALAGIRLAELRLARALGQ
jgi:outer membrane protein TolC